MEISKAIILAAGYGSRLRPLTNNRPKCFTIINGRSILVNALQNLGENGIKEVFLVVGYLGNVIKEELGKKFGAMKIKYIDNSDYKTTGTSHSLWLALRDLDDPVLILEGDVFFESKLINSLVEDNGKDLTVLGKYNPNLDGSFVSLGKNMQVMAWIHKQDRPDGFVLTDKYKTVNIHKFSRNFVKKWLLPFLRGHEEANGSSPLEFVFRDIIKNGGRIKGLVTQDKWFEIDDVNDLKIAEGIFKNE